MLIAVEMSGGFSIALLGAAIVGHALGAFHKHEAVFILIHRAIAVVFQEGELALGIDFVAADNGRAIIDGAAEGAGLF